MEPNVEQILTNIKNSMAEKQQQQQTQPAAADASVLRGLLELSARGQQDVKQQVFQQQQQQGQNQVTTLDTKRLFHIHRAITRKIFKMCSKCWQINYQNKQKFNISSDQEYLATTIILCLACALQNMNNSIQDQQMMGSNNNNAPQQQPLPCFQPTMGNINNSPQQPCFQPM